MLVEQAADILDLSERSVQRMCRDGEIQSEQVRLPVRYFYTSRSGVVKATTRLAWVWKLDGRDVRRVKTLRNRG